MEKEAKNKRGYDDDFISLEHFGQRFTPNAIPTLKVRLRFREEDCPAGQRVFLKHPPSPIEVSVEHISAEVVNIFANIERRPVWRCQGDVVSFAAPGLQEPILLAMGPAGSKYTVCKAENRFHLLSLGVKVAPWALDDANRVDPQVLYT